MSKNFESYIISLGEPNHPKNVSAWQDDMVQRLTNFSARLGMLIKQEDLADQIDQKAMSNIRGTAYLTLNCTPQMSERIRRIEGVEGVYNNSEAKPYGPKAGRGKGVTPATCPKGRNASNGPDKMGFIVTLKSVPAEQMPAHVAAFRKAAAKALSDKGLRDHMAAIPADQLANSLGILALDCTPEAARLIGKLPQVEEMRREAGMHTQKPGQDRGYKPTPPTSHDTGRGPDKNCWDPRDRGGDKADRRRPLARPVRRKAALPRL